GAAPGGEPHQGGEPPAEIRPGNRWVTRRGVGVDRIASAWLIRRWIDPEARFRFVPPRGYRPVAGELRFDMYEAEYTHEGDRCTFETLLARFRLGDPALRILGEIVHDIDCKDGKFGRAETPGLRRLIQGVTEQHPEDAARIEAGAVVLDALYRSYRR
ncbi:MAG TPA: chromate resistance protein ChrB domain-containing protein, partial [Gemmatimonadales bacterium]|nr:chromate resistance protein ChrB domain-containing protein [Gemmatimonadales bacterium]